MARVENGILFESQSPLPFAGGASLMFNLPMFMGMGQSRARFDRVTDELEQPNPTIPIKRPKTTLEKAGAN